MTVAATKTSVYFSSRDNKRSKKIIMRNQTTVEVFTLLQPDLLSRNDLINMIERRCCGVQNLAKMSTERLVELFRRVLFPLPQRFYRTNRRGKMLTARRARGGLQSDRRREAGNSQIKSNFRISLPEGGSKSEKRLDAVTDVKRPSLGSLKREEKAKSSESLVLNSSGQKVSLKRPSTTSEKRPPETETSAPGKKPRTAIKWP